jgi:hypothetical protein
LPAFLPESEKMLYPPAAPVINPEEPDPVRTVPTAIPEPRGLALGGVGLLLAGIFIAYRSYRGYRPL